MHRVLIEWRGIRVLSYPAMLYVGLVTGVILQTLVAERAGLPAARVYFATLTLLPIALAGSRVLYVMAHWPEFKSAPHLIWRRGEAGLAMYGGVPFMLVASIPVLAVFRLPFWAFWDTAVFCIFPGMAFARVGCLLNGCCSGRPTDGWLAMWLPDAHGRWAWRVPVQLLECSVALLLLGGSWLAIDRFTHPGRLFLSTVIGYAAARLALQGLRSERERAGRVDLHAAISLTLIVCALSVMYIL
jgi:phosphatidylglycerol:prolipoprotein diacylglycerol transferase